MPIVRFCGKSISCESGDLLRDVLKRAGLPPHNGNARWFNCKGLGTCGTCAVTIEGEIEEPSARERWRLSFPPHQPGSGLRLACQVRVNANLRVTKHAGFWGQRLAGPEPGSAP